MNTTYIITAIGGILCLLPFAYMAIKYYKLEKFRSQVSEGHTINYKFNGQFCFKTVKSRPSKELVILNDLDDETREIRTSIYKVYPL